jgi:NNP family nitrate/nitrite transporter-like MFS transporter
MLFITYGACFGVEIFIHNVAATFYVDRFGLSLSAAGMAAASFGLLALFARALGGYVSDKRGPAWRPRRRATVLFVFMLGEGLGLLVRPCLGRGHCRRRHAGVRPVHPHGLRRDLRAGAVHRSQGTWRRGRHHRRRRQRRRSGGGLPDEGPRRPAADPDAFGVAATLAALCAIAVRFSAEHKAQEQALYDSALAN